MASHARMQHAPRAGVGGGGGDALVQELNHFRGERAKVHQDALLRLRRTRGVSAGAHAASAAGGCGCAEGARTAAAGQASLECLEVVFADLERVQEKGVRLAGELHVQHLARAAAAARAARRRGARQRRAPGSRQPRRRPASGARAHGPALAQRVSARGATQRARRARAGAPGRRARAWAARARCVASAPPCAPPCHPRAPPPAPRAPTRRRPAAPRRAPWPSCCVRAQRLNKQRDSNLRSCLDAQHCLEREGRTGWGAHRRAPSAAMLTRVAAAAAARTARAALPASSRGNFLCVLSCAAARVQRCCTRADAPPPAAARAPSTALADGNLGCVFTPPSPGACGSSSGACTCTDADNPTARRRFCRAAARRPRATARWSARTASATGTIRTCRTKSVRLAAWRCAWRSRVARCFALLACARAAAAAERAARPPQGATAGCSSRSGTTTAREACRASGTVRALAHTRSARAFPPFSRRCAPHAPLPRPALPHRMHHRAPHPCSWAALQHARSLSLLTRFLCE
jgi:hypothetical protein